MVCSKCGMRLPDDARFCASCGQKMSSETDHVFGVTEDPEIASISASR